jgi:hypothetical protein
VVGHCARCLSARSNPANLVVVVVVAEQVRAFTYTHGNLTSGRRFVRVRHARQRLELGRQTLLAHLCGSGAGRVAASHNVTEPMLRASPSLPCSAWSS